jgi:Flp pilus assembly pilin Flp
MSESTISTEMQPQESGQTMAEYAVVLGVITIAIAAAFSLLSGGIQAAIERTVALVESVI